VIGDGRLDQTTTCEQAESTPWEQQPLSLG
jgi:hypothetical protein